MNLLSYGSKFDLWNYRTNVGSAYVVTRDAEIDPLGIGNMADQIEAQVGSYGGLKNSTAILEPNTTYYFSIWMYSPEGYSGGFTFRLYQANTIGTLYAQNSSITSEHNLVGFSVSGDSYKNTIVGDQVTPNPWTKYTWEFTTPAEVDNTAPTEFNIMLVSGSTSRYSMWGATLDTVSGVEFQYDSIEEYGINSLIRSQLFFYPSIDEYDINNELVTTPFDPLRFGFLDYNLIRDGIGSDFAKWKRVNSLWYATTRDYEVAPDNKSNFADRIVSSAGQYGGLEYGSYIYANVTYTLSVYVKAYNSSSSISFRYWNNQTGSKFWGGVNNPIDYPFAYQAYYSVPDDSEWHRVYWTFTAPANVVDPIDISNCKYYIDISSTSDVALWGAQLVVGSSPIVYQDQVNNSYSMSYAPSILDVFPPSIDELDGNGDPITTLFDVTRYAQYSRLGKNAVPYGNTFDRLSDDGLEYLYSYTNVNKVYPNLVESPVDPVLNEFGIGNIADLIEGVSIETASGMTAEWKSITDLVEGTVYTVSTWIKTKYLNSVATLQVGTSGNWFTGFEDQAANNEFSHISWKTENGSFQITENELSEGEIIITPSVNEERSSPAVIPSDKKLYERVGAALQFTSANFSSEIFTYDATASTQISRDVSLLDDVDLSEVELLVKNCTFLYQEHDRSILPSRFGVDFWGKIASEYTRINGYGVTEWAYDDTMTSENHDLKGWGILFYDTTGRKHIKIFKQFNPLQHVWSVVSYSFTPPVGSVNVADSQGNVSSVTIDETMPVGVGIFVKGKLEFYGALRLFDQTTHQSNYVSTNTSTWNRAELTFTTTRSQGNRLFYQWAPGTADPLRFSYKPIPLRIILNQPSQPLIEGNPDPAYLPWTPLYASSYVYGLMINEGATADAYVPDEPEPLSYPFSFIASNAKAFYPKIDYIGDIEIKVPYIKSWNRTPKHKHGQNQTGNSWYGTNNIFLNIVKHASGGIARDAVDYGYYFPQTTKYYGWLYRDKSVDGNGVDNSFSTFGTRLIFRKITFNAGETTFIIDKDNGGDWYKLLNDVLYDKRMLGEGVAEGTKFVSAVETPSTVVATVDTPFTANSIDLDSKRRKYWYIKKFRIDHTDDLNMDDDGYPRIIPTGYKYSMMAARNSSPWRNIGASMMIPPFHQSGRYVLRWEGEGDITMENTIGLSASSHPVTEISRTSNSITYYIDCSGRTADGKDVYMEYGIDTQEEPEILWHLTQAGFLITWLSTNPANHIRNVELVEERYLELYDSGEKFYPEFLERQEMFKCQRFLDYSWANVYHFCAGDISMMGKLSHASYVNQGVNVPHEIMIEICNRLKQDCWLNVPVASPPEYYIHIATMFRDNLDPSLRLYLECGNEPWNGALATGQFLSIYGQDENLISVLPEYEQTSGNPTYTASLLGYAKYSQYVFDIFDSVFAGSNGLLQPYRSWDDPKQQKRRLIRCLGTFGRYTTITVWRYAKYFTKNILGIPYDAITENGYYSDFLEKEVLDLEKLAAPALYPWTLNEVVHYAWEGLHTKLTYEDNHYYEIYKVVNEETGENVFGLDTDGDVIIPSFTMYEGGLGCPGPSATLLYNIMRLLWEEDGVNTIYHIYSEAIEWWINLVKDHPKSDECVFLNWKSPQQYGRTDQWAITPKSNYTEPEYYSFPRVRAFYEEAKIMSLPVVELFGSNYYQSKPKVKINNQWVDISNVNMRQNNMWMLRPAYIIKYRANNNWN